MKSRRIEVKRIDSCMQKADMLTKGLGKSKFEEIRLLLCGWQLNINKHMSSEI